MVVTTWTSFNGITRNPPRLSPLLEGLSEPPSKSRGLLRPHVVSFALSALLEPTRSSIPRHQLRPKRHSIHFTIGIRLNHVLGRRVWWRTVFCYIGLWIWQRRGVFWYLTWRGRRVCGFGLEYEIYVILRTCFYVQEQINGCQPDRINFWKLTLTHSKIIASN